MKIFYTIACSVLLLTGCGSAQYGIPESEWKKSSFEDKQKLFKEYHRIQKEKAIEQLNVHVTSATPQVKVTLNKGQAMMPPFEKKSKFKSASVTVYQGRCSTTTLRAIKGTKHIDIEVCYRGNEVLVDPSRTDYEWRYGTVRFFDTPIWERGFTYHGISTKGYARLTNSDITIKKVHPTQD